ncbi:uncharacterized protein LOC128271068 [Anopheles cruzii]|uniref:uncharacterized protein LOC128271068 n=1 Tax=Anopheles cruzii TaxID=68878 RepID=UPI0022EC7EA2|nr:uncharacterized protein LOC128271068 [Anopheles cruzii]
MPPKLSDWELRQIVHNSHIGHTVEADEIDIKSWTIEPFSATRIGFLGDHYTLKVVFRIAAGTPEYEEQYFVKSLPEGMPSFTRYLSEIRTFSKETAIYRELMPQLQGTTYGARFAPRSFLRDGRRDDVLVFEDLSLQGFRVWSQTFDLPHLGQALRALARLHAAGIRLEQARGHSVAQLYPELVAENSWLQQEGYPRVAELEDNIRCLVAYAGEFYADEARSNPKLLESLPGTMRQIYELVQPSKTYRNVFSHADLWNNNLMFRYESSTGNRPIECVLVDFQLARYVPPAYDFNMLVTLTTAGHRTFLRKHWTHLQSFFYQSLKTELAQMSGGELSVEAFVTLEDFRTSSEHYRKAAALDSFIINYVVKLPKGCLDETFSTPELYDAFVGENKSRQMLELLRSHGEYRETMKDIIANMVEIFQLG